MIFDLGELGVWQHGVMISKSRVEAKANVMMIRTVGMDGQILQFKPTENSTIQSKVAGEGGGFGEDIKRGKRMHDTRELSAHLVVSGIALLLLALD